MNSNGMDVVCRQIEDMYKSVHAAIRESPEATAKPEKPEEQVKKKRYVANIAVLLLFVYDCKCKLGHYMYLLPYCRYCIIIIIICCAFMYF